MHWRDTRWLLLALFLVGFITCQDSLGGLGAGFVALTALDTAACAILLSRLSAPLEQTLWAWIGLVVILDGYFARMYWFAYHLNRPVYINRNYPELRWVTRARILASYPWVSAGFVVFCLASTVLLALGKHVGSQPSKQSRAAHIEPWSQVVIAAFLLYLLGSLLQFRLGYGVRGVANPSLPLHLGTVVTVLRQAILPGLLILALWVFDGRDRRWTGITLWLLFLCGTIDSLLSASRGQLLTFTVPVFVLWAVTGRFTRQRKFALIFVLFAATILVPVVSSYRTQRITGSRSPGSSHISVEVVAQSAFFLGERAGEGGVEAVWYSLDHLGSPSVSGVLHFLKPNVFTRYYTAQIVGVRAPNDYRSSGLFGGLLIIGSTLVLVLGTVGIVGMLGGLWIGLRRLRCAPVAIAMASVTATLAIADPTGIVVSIPKLLVLVVVCEVVYRRLTRPDRPEPGTHRSSEPGSTLPHSPDGQADCRWPIVPVS